MAAPQSPNLIMRVLQELLDDRAKTRARGQGWEKLMSTEEEVPDIEEDMQNHPSFSEGNTGGLGMDSVNLLSSLLMQDDEMSAPKADMSMGMSSMPSSVPTASMPAMSMAPTMSTAPAMSMAPKMLPAPTMKNKTPSLQMKPQKPRGSVETQLAALLGASGEALAPQAPLSDEEFDSLYNLQKTRNAEKARIRKPLLPMG